MGKRKKRFYKKEAKSSKTKKVLKQLAEKDAKIYITQGIGCNCDERIKPGEHHLMGIRAVEKYNVRTGTVFTRFYADFITSWNHNGKPKPGIKKALRAVRKNEHACDGGLRMLDIHKQTATEGTEKKARKQRDKKVRKQRRH